MISRRHVQENVDTASWLWCRGLKGGMPVTPSIADRFASTRLRTSSRRTILSRALHISRSTAYAFVTHSTTNSSQQLTFNQISMQIHISFWLLTHRYNSDWWLTTWIVPLLITPCSLSSVCRSFQHFWRINETLRTMGRQPTNPNTTPTFREGQSTKTDTLRIFENRWTATNYEKTTPESNINPSWQFQL